jgi:hypothetical protein
MNAWSHLPNAHHIDRVLESVKSHPEIWDAARDAAHNDLDWYAATDAAMNAARETSHNEAWDAALNARLAAQGAAWIAAQDAAWNAAVALVAFDDASKYLEMASDQLRVWAIISETPAAILLIPAMIAFERINELENAV